MTVPYADFEDLNQTSSLIELYKLDCTAIGGSIYYLTNTPTTNGTLTFAGIAYTSIPVSTSGWDFTSTGAPPRPTLSISNVNKTLLLATISLGDLVGATLSRIRTFEKYLDTGSTPDSSKFQGPEVYVVRQKTGHTSTYIQWQLSSILEQTGMRIPRRQVLKDKGFPGVSRTRVR